MTQLMIGLFPDFKANRNPGFLFLPDQFSQSLKNEYDLFRMFVQFFTGSFFEIVNPFRQFVMHGKDFPQLYKCTDYKNACLNCCHTV